MRTFSFVEGHGVVSNSAARVLQPRRRGAFIPSGAAAEVIEDLRARGFVDLELARRAKRRARVLRACDPDIALELELYARELANGA